MIYTKKLLILAGTVLKPDIKSLLKYNNATVYWQIISSIIYLLNYTRPNTSYTIGQLARFIAVLGESYYRLSKQLLQYLNGTLKTGITYLSRAVHLPLYRLTLTNLPTSYSIFTNTI